MIEKSTVFILGAGASAPYGFPLGTTLIGDIIKSASEDNEALFSAGRGINITTTMINQFKEDLEQANLYSIDTFLANRRDYIDIGKILIAHSLIPYEKSNTLRDDWYQYIFNKMIEDTPFERFGENKISIITFNYDRSFEYYMCNCLKSTYGKTEEEAAEQLSKINIIHVHGQLGLLPWQSKDEGRPYNDNFIYLGVASAGIKIISEDIDDSREFNISRELIAEAEIIYFIGFGYHKTNMQRLRISLKEAQRPKIFCSVFGLTRNDENNIRHMLQESSGIIFGERHHDALNFLKNNWAQ